MQWGHFVFSHAADVTWEIPGIHVAKTGGSPNLSSTNQSRDGCVVRIGHPIVFVEGRDVPGDVRRNAGEKGGDVTELFAGIIEARDNQSHNFQPEALLIKALNAVQHAVEAAAEFPIVSVAEALEIHLVQIDPRLQIVDDFRRSVPIRDVRRLESLPARCAKDFHRPLAGNERFIVGAGDNSGLMAASKVDQILGSQIARRGGGIGIAQGLRGKPVLTISTMVVAAQHPKTQCQRARECMKERFLLDRIALQRSDVTLRNVERASFIEPNFADARQAVENDAPMAAREAPHAVVVPASRKECPRPCALQERLRGRLFLWSWLSIALSESPPYKREKARRNDEPRRLRLQGVVFECVRQRRA